MIDEASRVVMQPNDPELKTVVFDPQRVARVDGEVPTILSTHQPTVIFVIK